MSTMYRSDFQETSDPALQESAERGKADLLGYDQLYDLSLIHI